MYNKKLSLILLLFVGMTGYVHAQALSESLKITPDQVPAAIKKSYEKEFGDFPQDGKWTVRVTRTNENGRAVTNPVSYSYTSKVNREKIEVRFSPEGEVLNSKGLAKKNIAGQTTEPGSSEQSERH